MAKLISLFNHKGGVSKTTTTYNLGWAIAEMNYRVMMVDGDPQCNLTGTVLGFNDDDNFRDFYANRPKSNINNCLHPVFKGQQTELEAAELVNTQMHNLYLLGGHIDLSESEAQLSVALSTGVALPALQNLPGAAGHLIRLTAEKNNIDFVLIDMSPSIGPLNECLLMASDFFIVPTNPDFFCHQAIGSLAKVLPRWNVGVEPFRSNALKYPFPKTSPKFLGIVSQRYRPLYGKPAKSFQRWIDNIKDSVANQLIPELEKSEMAISRADFEKIVSADSPYNLANIADFNSLIAQSQKHNRPVFSLTDEQIEQQGQVLEKMKESRDQFMETFRGLALSVTQLCI